MGSVRFLLALSVVLAHYGEAFKETIIDAQIAVQMFYVVSGYLISIVLTEVKSYSEFSKFYVNRALRIYPIYYAVLFLAALLSLMEFIQHSTGRFLIIQNLPTNGAILVVISNITLFFQDLVLFTSVQNGEFHFSNNFRETDVNVWKGLLIPQAWTLGLELTFYLIAPFILKNRNIIFMLFGTSLAIKFYLYSVGFNYDPWTYRFFPAELNLFLLGAISHQVWSRQITEHALLNPKINLLALTVILLFIVFYNQIPLILEIKKLMIFSLLFLTLPFISAFQKGNRFDSKIAELSYPMYICHFLVIEYSSIVFTNLSFNDQIVRTILVVVVTIAFSVILNKLVSEKIEKLRTRIRNNKTGNLNNTNPFINQTS